ncbi:hypothetical protein B0H13DRAFT_1853181 [Mycena leptocephala]|nr:hypothetical protein B0H13DRAFT_1853181 [Mycena leptocephala]
MERQHILAFSSLLFYLFQTQRLEGLTIPPFGTPMETCDRKYSSGQSESGPHCTGLEEYIANLATHLFFDKALVDIEAQESDHSGQHTPSEVADSDDDIHGRLGPEDESTIATHLKRPHSSSDEDDITPSVNRERPSAPKI